MAKKKKKRSKGMSEEKKKQVKELQERNKKPKVRKAVG